MPIQPPPPDWGNDEITKFIDISLNNTFATFANLKPEFSLFIQIDRIFRAFMDNLVADHNWFACFFILRTHSAFLASIRLSISGQVVESYATQRVALEQALYGFHITVNPALRETWLNRHQSDEQGREVRREFTIRHLLDSLRAANADEARVAEILYERTIDFGAHPNERALTHTLHMNKGEDRTEFKVDYLTTDGIPLRLSLKTTAQIGVCTLGVYQSVFRDRFDQLGLSAMLAEIRQGL
jgi:hypothetical protein